MIFISDLYINKKMDGEGGDITGLGSVPTESGPDPDSKIIVIEGQHFTVSKVQVL